MSAIRRKNSINRGIAQRADLPEASGKIRGPFRGTMQAGPARPKRAHGLSDEHLDRGLLYVEKAIWDDAIKEFQKAVDLTPDFSEGYNNLGVCLLYTERIDEAVKALNEAVRNYPGWSLALANLGLAYSKAKKTEQAINYYRQAVTRESKQPQVWEALGEILEAGGKTDEAADAYREAVKHYPRYDLALHRLGMLLARKAEFDEAEKHLKLALELNPKLSDAAGVLGAISARRGALSAAQNYFEIAKSVNPEKVPPTAARGLKAIEQYEKGVKHCTEELLSGFGDDLPSIAECMFNAGLSYFKNKNLGMAHDAFRNAQKEDPNWSEPIMYLGMIEALDKDPNQAKQHWEAARKLDPKNGLLCETLGLAALAMGLNKEADRFFDEARKLGRAVPLPGSSASTPATAAEEKA